VARVSWLFATCTIIGFLCPILSFYSSFATPSIIFYKRLLTTEVFGMEKSKVLVTVYEFQGGGFFMCIYTPIMCFATRSIIQ
jgi:hypothetical protein